MSFFESAEDAYHLTFITLQIEHQCLRDSINLVAGITLGGAGFTRPSLGSFKFQHDAVSLIL